jgi:hypothetical protein
LVSACRELAGVVQDGLVLGARAHLLERRDRHGGQEADDDDDDHDFDKGEALGGAANLHMYVGYLLYYLLVLRRGMTPKIGQGFNHFVNELRLPG